MAREAKITDVICSNMQRWPLYDPTYQCWAVAMNSGFALGYCAERPRLPFGTYWSANIIGDKFYLLEIQIAKAARGNGNGAALYQIIEDIANDYGCCEIRQTPSGWTHGGGTRRAYLEKRGWISDGVEAFKRLAARAVNEATRER